MISRLVSLRVFLRTFFLQAGWNYDRMQHLGFAFAMLPGIRRVHGTEEARVAAARRHLEYFNTHPFLAPALIGAALHLEAEVAAGTRRPDEVTSFKTGIMGSYGAIGDSFFWAALRPFGAVAAVALILMGFGAWGPAIFLLGYNAIALVVRAYGFFGGVRLGPMVVAKLARFDFAGGTRALKLASAAAAGLCLALWARNFPDPAPPVTGEAVAFPLAVALAGTARRGVPPAFAAAALAIGLAIWKGLGGKGF